MTSNPPPHAFLFLLSALAFSHAAFNCQVSLNLSAWPTVPRLAPLLTHLKVGACPKQTTNTFACDLHATNGSVTWYSTAIVPYEAAPNAPVLLNLLFSNPNTSSTSFVFASTATVYMTAAAPPSYQVYTFQSAGNLGLTVTTATSRVIVDGENSTQSIYFTTLFRCQDECSAACQSEYDFPGRTCLSPQRFIGGEVSNERCMADRDACYEECASSRL